LGPVAAGRLYSGYRGEQYFRQRHEFEPWYSRAKNDSIGSESQMEGRRLVLATSIELAERVAGPRPLGACVDYGGDRGQMLRDLNGGPKWVFDLSGVDVDPWAAKAGSLDDLKGRCALALNCQVLEHVDDPLECLRATADLVAPGGWLYVEVPHELWRQQSWLGERRRGAWLDWLSGKPSVFKALDFLSTACRLATGVVPFFGFWAMREHLNFFTENSLEALARRAGLSPVWTSKTESGISLVAIKPNH
jgi:SAM-dependent methyltransferase